MNPKFAFWSLSGEQLLQETHSTTAGLSRQEASQRLSKYGSNSLRKTQKSSALVLLLNQFKSPIILILIFAATLSIFLQDTLDAIIRLNWK
jgi:P-type Mg2+ transporter